MHISRYFCTDVQPTSREIKYFIKLFVFTLLWTYKYVFYSIAKFSLHENKGRLQVSRLNQRYRKQVKQNIQTYIFLSV